MKHKNAGLVLSYPVFDETGLGNKLIVWAKCAAWSRRNGAVMLDPDWTNRASGDPSRRYLDLFRRRSWPYRWLRGLVLRRFSNVDFRKGMTRDDLGVRGPVVVAFSGLGDAELIGGESAYIRDKLLAKIHPSHRLRKHQPPFIGVHVRRGDFQEATEDDLRRGRANARQPIQWYRAALEKLRAELGGDVPITVFSDGRDQELESLLQMDNTSRSEYSSPLLDLQSMAEAACLVGSRSTFTAAGSYLGQVPTLYFPGARAASFSLLGQAGQDFSLEPEWDYGDELPSSFVAAVRARLQRAKP